jgi:hypothetical protein
MRLAKSPLAMADLAAPQAQITARGAVSKLFLQSGLNQLVVLQMFGHICLCLMI